MTGIWYILIAAQLLVTGAVSAAEPPAKVAEAFYDRFIHPMHKDYDRPYFERVDDLVGKNLFRALQAQNKYELVCARLAPPEIKPHMFDQNPFFLAPDGAKSMIGVQERIKGRTAKVVTTLGYGALTWQDTLLLRKENGRWVIVDILWGDGGSLTGRLVDFASDQCSP